jgi:SAM-dependent methyltransferase
METEDKEKMSSLHQIYYENKLHRRLSPLFSDKEHHGYISTFYENAFVELRDKEIVLLELGIQRGGSLLLWSKYFSKGIIYGVDISESLIDDEVKSLDNVKIIIADAYNESTLDLIPDCDIIIDDALHTAWCQDFVIRNYSKKLKPGGIMVIEDVSRLNTAVWLKGEALSIGFTNSTIFHRDRGHRRRDILLVIRKD